MTGDTSIVAVLSGDLIGSSEAPPKETSIAINRILATTAKIETWDGNGPTYFTRMRGDGWQIVISNPTYALRAALKVFANQISAKETGYLQTRIAIGLGTMNAFDGADLSSASGSAFEASGRTLDAMTRSDRFAIAGSGVSPLHQAVVELTEEQIGRWTPEQAEAAAYYLSPSDPTLKDIAGELGISTQAVHSRIRGAGAQALRNVVEHWEDTPC